VRFPVFAHDSVTMGLARWAGFVLWLTCCAGAPAAPRWKVWPLSADSTAGAQFVPRVGGGQTDFLYGWGHNQDSSLGVASDTSSIVTGPQQLTVLPPLVAVTAGESHTVGLTAAGDVLVWGGSLGEGPQSVVLPDGEIAVQVEAGAGHTLVRTRSGAVFAWGANARGQLGLGPGSPVATNTPTRVVGLPNVTSVAAGRAHSLAVGVDGTVWACTPARSRQTRMP
jgi:alpha-tubulin suppressor-like RCC1 family protein